MATVSSSKETATIEYDALGDLGKHVSNALSLSPLTKAMVNQQIANIQETLRSAWGIDLVEGNKDPGFFEIEADLLKQHGVQMKASDGTWVGVNYTAFEHLQADVLIRLLYYNKGKERFYEANGKTEFILTSSPYMLQMHNQKDTWLVNYQI